LRAQGGVVRRCNSYYGYRALSFCPAGAKARSQARYQREHALVAAPVPRHAARRAPVPARRGAHRRHAAAAACRRRVPARFNVYP
jgi:hypothetical protein